MRIVSKIKKEYGNIKNLLKNDYFHNITNIKSITFDGLNIYLLCEDDVYSYNYETDIISKLNIKINNGKKIEYNNNHLYILDNHIYDYDIQKNKYVILIQGPINQFAINTEYILYDKNDNVYKYTRSTKMANKIPKMLGGLVDMIADNQNLFLCYNNLVQKYNLSTGYTSTITESKNIKSLSYDGLLIYIRIEDENDNIIKIYTKNGLEYTESKIINLTKIQDIVYDGNYIYYREDNLIYKFDEEMVFYDYDIEKVNKMKYFYTNNNTKSEIIFFNDNNLIIKNDLTNNVYKFNYNNIIDYAYSNGDKYIINDNNIFVINKNINEFPKIKNIKKSEIQLYYKSDLVTLISHDDNIISRLYLDNSNQKYIIEKIYKHDILPNAVYLNEDINSYFIIDNYKIIKYIKEDINRSILEEKYNIIRSKSLFKDIKYSIIENNDDKIYIKDILSNKTYFINNKSRYDEIINLDNKILSMLQIDNHLYIIDNNRNIKKINILSNTLIESKEINLDGNNMLFYNNKILIGSNNVILRYDNNLNIIDNISSSYYKGNNDINIISIKSYNGNLMLCDKKNKQIIRLNTNNNDNHNTEIKYNINDEKTSIKTPVDMDIYNNYIYIAVEENSNIIKYEIINDKMNIIKNNSLISLINMDVKINKIKYCNDMNGLLIGTNRGLYLIDENIDKLICIFDKYNNIDDFIYYNDNIYVIDGNNINKYSKSHYMTECEYTFKESINNLEDGLEISNYSDPKMINTNRRITYVLDNNKINYYFIDDVNNEKYIMYSLYNYNQNQDSKIIDFVVDDKYLYILKENNVIDIVKENGNIDEKYDNIDGIKITLPTKEGYIYYISKDNKIKKYDKINSSIILENKGILNDEQSFYIYNNKVIKRLNKNKTGMTQLEDNIYYTDDNKLYNLNKNGITEKINIEKKVINGLSNHSGNIIMCDRYKVEKFNPFDINIKLNKIVDNLNNPFKCVLEGNFYFVSDTFNHRILKINKNTLEKTILTTGLNYPRGIDYNKKDNYLYVVDCGTDKIIKINPQTGNKINLSQIINGIVDLYFDNEIMYITSLLQNTVYQIDTLNNYVLSTFLKIEKPYYIDYGNIFLISTDDAFYTKELSYLDLNNLITESVNRITQLVKNNQIYNTNNKFKLWIDNELSTIENQKNLNNKYNSLHTLEKILNTMNHSMDYTDSADAVLTTNFEVFKNRTFLLFKSVLSIFGGKN